MHEVDFIVLPTAKFPDFTVKTCPYGVYMSLLGSKIKIINFKMNDMKRNGNFGPEQLLE